ncbi:histone-lysine N-methyltransferase SETDB1-B-like isoform X2 [Oreochromis aureus]|uniref:histone-lysine N-methyltransferase SETDB1-B-like isoform X2 n=1 Tax=Oreochromis aureus TaxID=47969 RepID=UPI0019532691|nr:histone-lysine N-methyltransferase SETDB1-B-like isoform X2 [Oreochromis aureus]
MNSPAAPILICSGNQRMIPVIPIFRFRTIIRNLTRTPAVTQGNPPTAVLHETTNIRPNLPQDEVKVDMMVLARKKHMKWQRGKIVEIITKEDGRLKYKVSFEEKGKILVSGRHIAFDTTPKVEHLFVGTRVVVQCQDNKFRFRSGVLAELPSRKNHFRFLVFMDDHTPVYVGLPFFHLACRPLENMLDDIPGGLHKHFMEQYMKDWPYPHLTKYSVGQSLNAEYLGEQQRCEVQVIDCSLIQVVFQRCFSGCGTGFQEGLKL